MPPRHCGLKISPVTTLRRTRSLRSLKQALRLTPPAKFSPFGHRPPFKGAGSCTSAELSSCMGCGLHFRYLRFSYAGATPHRSTCLFLHARGSFASPLCGSLMIDVQSHTGADPHTIKNCLNHTQRLIPRMLLPIRTREARRTGPALPGFLLFHTQAQSAA